MIEILFLINELSNGYKIVIYDTYSDAWLEKMTLEMVTVTGLLNHIHKVIFQENLQDQFEKVYKIKRWKNVANKMLAKGKIIHITSH